MKLTAIVDGAFERIKRELRRLAQEHTHELAKATKELEAVHVHPRKAGVEIERLCQRLDDYDSKLAIRDNDITRLEIQLEDQRRSNDPTVRP
jgi:predicted RNase H-like nuclease